jgi:hypothetical protein
MTFRHIATNRLVRLEGRRAIRHCQASPYWEEA